MDDSEVSPTRETVAASVDAEHRAAGSAADDRVETAVLEPDPDTPAPTVFVEPATLDLDAVTRGPAAGSVTAHDPTGWFEQLYVAALRGEAVVPWDRGTPSVLLVEWAQARQLDGSGQRALVVGCGLGRDSEYVASLGFDTVAFDIAPTAVRTARERHPGTTVDYLTADLLHPPAQWFGAYDLVVEDMNIQSLPEAIRAPAITNTAAFVAAGGTLIVVSLAPYTDHEPEPGPPWPLSRAEIDRLAAGDLRVVEVENIPDATDPTVHRWRAEFRRPA